MEDLHRHARIWTTKKKLRTNQMQVRRIAYNGRSHRTQPSDQEPEHHKSSTETIVRRINRHKDTTKQTAKRPPVNQTKTNERDEIIDTGIDPRRLVSGYGQFIKDLIDRGY